jgi:cell filamentation protein
MAWSQNPAIRHAEPMTPEERDQIESRFAEARILELRFKPVRGTFDAGHLREVNRRIFQDLPKVPGFENVTPGEFRPPVRAGKDWIKQRALDTVNGSFFVSYSRMDDAAKTRLDQVLEGAKPDALRGLNTQDFTQRLGELYADLDHVHPFLDGNSRTLRAFTGQLAREAGYAIDWDRFSRTPIGRDLLYIARDRSVNEIAKPHIQHPYTMKKVINTLDRTYGNRALPELLRDVVCPSRAIAFEKLPEAEALERFPELAPAYKTMRAAPAYFASKMPGDKEAQKAGVQAAVAYIQTRLNAGETQDFSRLRVQKEKERQAPQGSRDVQPSRPGPE